jgi:hypothetical protein
MRKTIVICATIALSVAWSVPALADARLACAQFAPLLATLEQNYSNLSANAGDLPAADGDYAKLLPPDALAALDAARASGKKLSADIDDMVNHLQDAVYAMQKCAR